MARTMFVNPSFINPRKRKSKKRKGSRSLGRFGMRGRVTMTTRNPRGRRRYRRNAGITPFIQNPAPLILANPRRRRRAHRNPLAMPDMKAAFDNALSYAGGTAVALAVTTVGTSKIDNAWVRRGAQLGISVVGGSMLGKKSAAMGGAFAGAMMYPLLQDLAADLLGIGVGAGVAAKEADLDALAADLEDVLDDMQDSDVLGDDGDEDDEEYAW